MIQSFRTENGEVFYTVEGKFKNRTEILKALATYKKERLDKVKAKFKKFVPGYLVEHGGLVSLYEADGDRIPKGARNCVIVRR